MFKGHEGDFPDMPSSLRKKVARSSRSALSLGLRKSVLVEIGGKGTVIGPLGVDLRGGRRASELFFA